LTEKPRLNKTTKRSVKDIPVFLDDKLFIDLESDVAKTEWNYKTQMFLQTRDKALVSLLMLTGLRISEALGLRKKQFRVYEDKVLIANAVTLKHGLLRPKIILTRKGRLAPFTEIFLEWFNQLPEYAEFVFGSGSALGISYDQHIKRARAHWIIKTTTGKFPHWYRSVCESIYARSVFHNDAWKLKAFMGLKSLESTGPYVSGNWEENEKDIDKV
jgi:integrase